MKIDRNVFTEEQILREFIRKAIKVAKKSKRSVVITEEKKLRRHVRKLLKEVEVEDEVPHHNTGINVLEDLLKKIVPSLEGDYKRLTTDVNQRKSFRAHIISAVQNAITPGRTMAKAGNEEAGKMISVDEDLLEVGETEEEINIDVGDDMDGPSGATSDVEADIPNDEEAFIDIDKKAGDDEVDTFSLPGEDLTGRNMALSSFEKIEKNILDSYGVLSNEEDRTLFYDYLLTNLKLYFDKFEDELQPALDEPSTDEYEQEMDDAAGTEATGLGAEEEPAI